MFGHAPPVHASISPYHILLVLIRFIDGSHPSSLPWNSHETTFYTASTFKVVHAIESGVRLSPFSPGYLSVFPGCRALEDAFGDVYMNQNPSKGCKRKPWRACKGTDLPDFYRRRGGYILTIASLRYQTSWNCQTSPGHVQNKPTRIAHAPGSIPRAHRPIAIIDQPTGPMTELVVQLLELTYTSVSYTELVRASFSHRPAVSSLVQLPLFIVFNPTKSLGIFPGSIPRAHRPIAIIDQPTGPLTGLVVQLLELTYTSVSYTELVRASPN
ncbi:hypothetical protein F2Q69_00042360 [Brassica cretica]|uniref:Uncharacterized protein n=1 Tax=Brassica cretica TaxID=69181 RepID=A0A8S9NIB3_BRACR|nr:hypothetical protein F2Q69_00042360 [Brassica cretica]